MRVVRARTPRMRAAVAPLGGISSVVRRRLLFATALAHRLAARLHECVHIVAKRRFATMNRARIFLVVSFDAFWFGGGT